MSKAVGYCQKMAAAMLFCGVKIIGIVSICFALCAPVLALSPEEQLSDPILEERARDLSAQLRCLVCQNQSIDDSDAELAQDLRREVRSQLRAGRADDDILASLQNIYGDYILLKPPVSRATSLLWAAPVILLVLAGGLFWHARRSPRPDEADITQPEITQPDMTQTDMTQTVSVMSDDAPSKSVVVAVLAFVGFISAGLYISFGSPELASQPSHKREAERKEAQAASQVDKAQRAQALAEAQRAVATAPNSLEARLELALAYARLDDFTNEVVALRQALELADGAPVVKAMLAEALSRQADGQVTLPARALIADVLSLVPDEPRALYIAGLAAYQDEAYERAITMWSQLVRTAPPQTAWSQLARQNISAAADKGGLEIPQDIQALQDRPTGPDAEMMASMADASQDEQQDMIEAMVASLEDRLREKPNDEAGWQRLIQARRVLEDRAGLLRALIAASDALPDNRQAQLDLLEYGLSLQPEAGWFAPADRAIARLGANQTAQLETLFFAGHLARLKGDNQIAIGYFTELHQRLPDDETGFKDQLKELIANLK